MTALLHGHAGKLLTAPREVSSGHNASVFLKVVTNFTDIPLDVDVKLLGFKVLEFNVAELSLR